MRTLIFTVVPNDKRGSVGLWRGFMVRWSCHCVDTGLVYLHGMYYLGGWDPLAHSESLQVISSVIAAWSDVSHASTASTGGLGSVTSAVSTLNVGYIWMFGNCLTSAAYVSICDCKKAPLSSSLAGFGYAQKNQSNRLFRLGLDVL